MYKSKVMAYILIFRRHNVQGILCDLDALLESMRVLFVVNFYQTNKLFRILLQGNGYGLLMSLCLHLENKHLFFYWFE